MVLSGYADRLVQQLSRILRALVADGRWRRSLALAVAFAIGCGLLSWWQFSRRADTAEANALITQNASAPARPLDALLPALGSYRSDQQWRTARVTGTYLVAGQLLARNRVVDGDPGFEVLTPFRLTDGRVFVLDRGFVATSDQNQNVPDPFSPPPSGTVTVLARLQANEGPIPGRSAPAGEIPSIDLEAIAKRVALPTFTAAYGEVRSESPAAAGQPARMEPQTVDLGTDEGTHLSYAIQWILFAMLGFGALGWSIRRDLLDAGDDVIVAADRRATARRATRAPSDESVEDALTGS